MIHTYTLSNNKLKPLQLILLAVALLFDLIGLFMIPSAILVPKYWFLIIGSFLFWLCVRISTIYYTYSLTYMYYKEHLIIKKIYYRKEYVLLDINKKDIKNIYESSKEDNIQNFCLKSCVYPSYVVELQNGKKYLINMDNTLFSALTCEEKYDLFR